MEQRAIEAFVIDRVKDDVALAELPGLPLQQGVRQLLEHCPVVLTGTNQEQPSLPFNNSIDGILDTPYALRQPSPRHQRSFEVVLPEDAAWKDEYGNAYSSLNLKGNNFSRPSIMEHATASRGYIAWGLQESSIITRVLRASQVMRERGITTEHILGIAEPTAYPWPQIEASTDYHQTISLGEYRSRLVENYWHQLPDETRTMDKLIELQTAFNDQTFYISLRASDTPYRLHDIQEPRIRQAIFDKINSQLDAAVPHLEANSSDDNREYLVSYVAPSLARNTAKLHLDLAHHFLNELNIGALGGIVDLDSVRGEPLNLGDNAITDLDRAGDIFEILCALEKTKQAIVGINLSTPDTTVAWAFLEEYLITYGEHFSPQDRPSHIGSLLYNLRYIAASSQPFKGPHADQSHRLLSTELESYYYTEQLEEHLSPSHLATMQEDAEELATDNAIEVAVIDENSELIEEMIDDALHDLVTELSNNGYEAYGNKLAAFFTLERSSIAGPIMERILQSYEHRLQQVLKGKAELDVLWQDILQSAEAKQYGLRSLVSRFNEPLQQAAEAITSRLLAEARDKANQYNANIPPPLLGTQGESYLLAGEASGHFWRHTAGISPDSIFEFARAHRHEAFYNQEYVNISLNTIGIPLEDGEWRLTEVLSPEDFGFHTNRTDDGDTAPYAVLEYDTVPPFVLTVECNSSGDRRFTLHTKNGLIEDSIKLFSDAKETAIAQDDDGQPPLFDLPAEHYMLGKLHRSAQRQASSLR